MINYPKKNPRGEFLVAIIKTKNDFKIALEEYWYRIPVRSVEKLLKNRFPPQGIAFYQPKIFGDEAYSINYYAEVISIEKMMRRELFPHEKINVKSNNLYYKLRLSSLQKLPKPIYSRRWRRITFIPTTWEKFNNAVEINDLWDESPLEDRLWAELKRLKISAERQEYIKIKQNNYFLDFAIYCAEGKIDVETDGDTYHSQKKQICQDLERDNDLKTNGWRILRFNTNHVQEKMQQYCIPKITDNINRLGGVKNEDNSLPKKIMTDSTTQYVQLNLFDL